VLKPERIPDKWPEYADLVTHAFNVHQKESISNTTCLPLRNLKRRRGDSGMCSRNSADTRASLMKVGGSPQQQEKAAEASGAPMMVVLPGNTPTLCSKPASNGHANGVGLPHASTNGYHQLSGVEKP